MAETSKNRVHLLVRNAVMILAGLLGLIVLIRLIYVRSYDYDELSHTHMAWLVSVGEVPYRDFAANHFPFFWILMSPLMRMLPENPATLMILRGLALMLNAVFIGAFAAIVCLEQHRQERIWTAACLGLVVFSPPAMRYLIEFRPDAFSNALLFSTLAWLSLNGSKTIPTALVSGFCIGVALLVNTKCALFPFVLGAVALIVHLRQVRRIWPFALSLCLGFGIALVCGFLSLIWWQVPLDHLWQMVVTYNATVERFHTNGLGLMWALTSDCWPWLAFCTMGLAVYGIWLFRQRQPPGLFAIAVAIFLSLSLATTTRPWKQYLTSWLILASYFPARAFPVLAARLQARVQLFGALCVFAFAIVSLRQLGTTALAGRDAQRVNQDRVIEWGVQHVPPDGLVAASFELHPVFRRDSFFKVVVDHTAEGFDGLEQLMPQLAPGPYGEHFQQSGYEKELELRPPTAMLNAPCPEAQVRALRAYYARHSDSYDQEIIPGTTIRVVERKHESPIERK